eukprot:CAMPEP_0185703760 /NCGR_PEP_ID=MMETSP1164-20130828/15403_1 /TAXON_ID=1104430 /ORGANISM="Chrysoreinhardia sp, Strain CCMP2950" /LENGTH=323 /DNA_ID=CAMNT_0028371069 /DNA_START=63 /DNA_END=1032 /DNA_ORIENTATION=+
MRKDCGGDPKTEERSPLMGASPQTLAAASTRDVIVVVRCPPAVRKGDAAAAPHGDDEHHNADDQRRRRVDFDFPPEDGLAQLLARLLELEGLLVEPVGLVDEELDALAALEDFFDVLDHDVLDVVELRLDPRDVGVVVRRRRAARHVRVVVVGHLPLEHGPELLVHREGRRAVRDRGVARGEAEFGVFEEGEGDAAARRFVGHAEVGHAVVDEVVEDVLVVDVRHARVVGRNLGEENARHRRKVPRALRVLGEHDRPARDDGVHDHLVDDRGVALVLFGLSLVGGHFRGGLQVASSETPPREEDSASLGEFRLTRWGPHSGGP